MIESLSYINSLRGEMRGGKFENGTIVKGGKVLRIVRSAGS